MVSTLRDLRFKEVINISDGSRYGCVGDLELEVDTGRIKYLIIPGQARFFGLFGKREDVFIPWEDVRRLGEDIILVEGEPRRVLPERVKSRWR